ncbi:inner membrane protein [Gammaproteobacteria bacterium]
MTDFFTNLSWGATHWHWWILGMILLGVEVFAPGFFFLWFGIASGIIGFILLLDPSLSWQIQIIFYALLSLASILAWRLWLRTSLMSHTDQPTLNRRTAQYVGRILTLEQPIVNGRGRIRIDDSWWPVEGEDLPIATAVRVLGVENMVLRVEQCLNLSQESKNHQT